MKANGEVIRPVEGVKGAPFKLGEIETQLQDQVKSTIREGPVMTTQGFATKSYEVLEQHHAVDALTWLTAACLYYVNCCDSSRRAGGREQAPLP